MQRGLELTHTISLAMIITGLAIMLGAVPIPAARRIPLARKSRISGGFMMCMAMSGNGARICGMAAMRGSRKSLKANGGAWTTGDSSARVLRGGSWSSRSEDLRSAYRNYFTSGFRFNYSASVLPEPFHLFILYIFTSFFLDGVQGRSPWWATKSLIEVRPLPSSERRYGPAIEAHFQFLLWLIPAVEKFPRTQRSCSATASRPRRSTCSKP